VRLSLTSYLEVRIAASKPEGIYLHVLRNPAKTEQLESRYRQIDDGITVPCQRHSQFVRSLEFGTDAGVVTPCLPALEGAQDPHRPARDAESFGKSITVPYQTVNPSSTHLIS
jgi:hypothetical protein